MESASEPLRIHCSEAAMKLVSTQDDSLVLSRRGTIDVKGKGRMTTYWLKTHGDVGAEQAPGAQRPLHMLAPCSEISRGVTPEPVAGPTGGATHEIVPADVEVSIDVRPVQVEGE